MYEYLDRPPQVGDVVAYIESSHYNLFTHNKLYIVQELHPYNTRLHPIIIRDNQTIDWANIDCFKVVKTKSATEAKLDDTVICVGRDNRYKEAYGKLFTIAEIMTNRSPNAVHIRTNPIIEGTSTPNLKNFLILCKAEEKQMNPFKVGDRVRCISNPNDQRSIGDEFTVIKVDYNAIYYKDGFAAYYKYFELVSRAESDISIKVGSHWERSYTSEFGKAGEIIQITKVLDNYVHWDHGSIHTKVFLKRFHPRPDLDKPQLLHQKWKDLYDQGVELEWSVKDENKWYDMDNGVFLLSFNNPIFKYRIKPSVQKTVEPIKQEKETQMNKLDLTALMSIMAAMAASEEVTKDATNSEYVCILTEDSNYVGYFYADTEDEAKKIMQSPEHEGRKLHMFKYETTIAQKPRKIISVDRV